MCWLLIIILLLPVISYAQEEIRQLVEIGEFQIENLDNDNPNRTIFLSSSNVHVFGEYTDEETKKDTLQFKKRKSPTTAFILSLIGGATFVPGLGQHYNGEHNKGFRIGAVWLAGWFIAAGTVDRDSEKTGQAIGLPLVFGAFIWSCIDAPLSANKINKSLQEQNNYGHLLEFNNIHYVWGIDLSIAENFKGTKLTVHF